MYLTESDWHIIVESNQLFNKFYNSRKPNSQSTVNALSKVFSEALIQRQYFPKNSFSENEKEILLSSFCLFCAITFEKRDFNDFSDSEVNLLGNDEYANFALNDYLKERGLTKLPFSENKSQAHNEDLDNEIEEMEEEVEEDDDGFPAESSLVPPNFKPHFKDDLADLYPTLKKIYSNAFELAFYPSKFPIISYADIGLLDIFNKLIVAIHFQFDFDDDLLEGADYYFKGEMWSASYIRDVVDGIVREFQTFSKYLQTKADSASIYNLLLNSLPKKENSLYKFTGYLIKEQSAITVLSKYDDILELLKIYPTILVCFHKSYTYTPYIINYNTIRPLKGSDIRPSKGDSTGLHFLAQVGINLSENNCIVKTSDLLKRVGGNSIPADSISRAVSQIKKVSPLFKNKIDIRLVKLKNTLDAPDLTGSYEVTYSSIPIILAE